MTLDEAIKAKEAELKASTADACDTAKREAAYCGEQRAAVPGTKHFPKIEMAELSITEAKARAAACRFIGQKLSSESTLTVRTGRLCGRVRPVREHRVRPRRGRPA